MDSTLAVFSSPDTPMGGVLVVIAILAVIGGTIMGRRAGKKR
ncbi:hypothetical protein [Amycolatopsis rifamycinica]|nr:hypothetical protein [Amycolatopsis rifamycinica]